MPKPTAFELPLKDSTPALFRPARSNDLERIKQGFELMSPESRYLRFFAPVQRLPEDSLRQLQTIDQRSHVAWGAIDLSAPQVPGIGLARFQQLEQSGIAEMSFVVIDAYQRRGVWTVLLGILYLEAAVRGICTLRANILPENRVPISKPRELGALVSDKGGTYQVDLIVQKDLSLLPQASFVQTFRQTIKKIRGRLCPQEVV